MPAASSPKRGETPVALPASLSAKVPLLNEMIAQHVAPAELARRLPTRPQEVNRTIDLRHTTKIDTIASALVVPGKRPQFTLAPA